MNPFFATLVLLSASLGVMAQPSAKNKSISKLQVTNSLQRKQINQLKDGVLLVRLKTKQPSIAALRKRGNVAKANQLERKQAEYNRSIVAAFRFYFDFCPTYFFYSDQSVSVAEKQLDKVVFLDDYLQPDSAIKLTTKNFLTAEFGNIEQDTAKSSADQSYEVNSNWSVETANNYNGGANLGFGALVIKSNQFVQLARPFPYYVRTFATLPIKRKAHKVVKKMNNKLHEFHTLING